MLAARRGGVRQGKWKLVAVHGGEWELHDLEADRTEQQNLASKQLDRVKELTALHQRWADRVGVVPWDKLQQPPRSPGAWPRLWADIPAQFLVRAAFFRHNDSR
jgi:arylsulfatase A-like enzyme